MIRNIEGVFFFSRESDIAIFVNKKQTTGPVCLPKAFRLGYGRTFLLQANTTTSCFSNATDKESISPREILLAALAVIKVAKSGKS